MFSKVSGVARGGRKIGKGQKEGVARGEVGGYGGLMSPDGEPGRPSLRG